MTPYTPALRYSCAAFAAAGALVGALTIPTGSAAAQTTYATTAREEITVTPPYVQHRTVGRSGTGIPIEEMSLSRWVDYSDLDLSRWDDVRMLDDRVRQAAYRACDELNRQYPESLYPSYQSSDRDCVARATNEGVAQARWAVANWRGYPANGGQRYSYQRYGYPPPYGE
jgi:UrcA family protein